jgi:hypothetical protein
MVKRLGAQTNVLKRGLQSIDSKNNVITLSDGTQCPYDKLVTTLPLWITRHQADFYVPEGVAIRLNLVQVSPKRQTFARWDYVYTPYTPANAIHRLSPSDGGYTVEANGDWDKIQHAILDDLGFLFPDGFAVERSIPNLKGHLLPLGEKPAWPDNIAPLGRFAKWDPRATTDITLRDASALAQRWWG